MGLQEAINALPEAERPEVICSASAVGKATRSKLQHLQKHAFRELSTITD